MPTDSMPSPASEHGHVHSSCPPEESWGLTSTHEHHTRDVNDGAPSMAPPAQQPTPPPTDRDPPARAQQPSELHYKPSDMPLEMPARDIPTPISATDESVEEQRNTQVSPLSATMAAPSPWSQHRYLTSPHPGHRFLPHTSSSFLRPGSRFKGNQTSDHQKYEVEVEIKYVDMRESLLCGYLRIKGLTQDHPSLTTYFEGEIIGSKYTFITQHPEWGSNEKVDRQHWARFPAYKPLTKYSSRPDLVTKDWMQKEHLFMRWKEYFLVPDHRVKTINGASFEGFYYICFNQITGGIEGIYFHAKSERFQKLQLEHVEDHGCQGAIEFR
ncbi:hypothetical protein P280DRAFT_139388 [Massarina eburnea CBS 473.64]|uniref:Uncharacterized protein n=1 Tax=Massarina eburnea CBS 473.64 TaxID=1395130 RepID=A0A6A6RPI2_9PLEO|nr:hypothetical protein P280DRAFT_139388 [Massarina eburnea CBS 473.64]